MMDQIEEETSVNVCLNVDRVDTSNAFTKHSQGERSSTANDVVDALIGLEKQYSKEFMHPFGAGESFEIGYSQREGQKQRAVPRGMRY